MIKGKLLIILIAIIIILIASVSFLTYRLGFVSDERDRWQNNFINDSIRFTDASGAEVLRVQELQFTIADLKGTNDATIVALLHQAKILGNRNRHLEQLISVKTETIIEEVFIPIRDTVWIREDLPDITRIAEISTKYLDVSVAIHPESIEILHYISRDEIIIVLKWYKTKRFFLTRWFERRKYAADIKSKNPNSRIRSAKNIRITGKRGR